MTKKQNDKILEIKSLKKSFNDEAVLKDINLSVAPGENVVVVGKSGVGKSVLIKCIVKLIEPDDGNILVFGKDISKMKGNAINAIRSRIGFLFQGAALYDSMDVRENLLFPLKRNMRNINQKEIDNRIEKVLESVQLPEAINKMPEELSGGMKKRIGLARTLVLEPDIILYDEPTTGLDPLSSGEISELIMEIQNQRQASSIIITHDVNCARITANRIVILKDGLIYAEGTFNDFKKSKDTWIYSFFN